MIQQNHAQRNGNALLIVKHYRFIVAQYIIFRRYVELNGNIHETKQELTVWLQENLIGRPLEEITLQEVDERLMEYLARMQYLLARNAYAQETDEQLAQIAAVDIV